MNRTVNKQETHPTINIIKKDNLERLSPIWKTKTSTAMGDYLYQLFNSKF